jgi:methylaspartate mutase epsilon subunit
LSDNGQRVWYLGGNLSVKETDHDVIRKFTAMGFNFVAPKPISWQVILENLLRDFDNLEIKKREVDRQTDDEPIEVPFLDTVDDEKMTDQEFLSLRNQVLSSWPTGLKVLETDIKKNHSNPSKNLHNVIAKNLSGEYRPLLQPRTGVAHISDEITILQFLRENGLDVSSIQLDAASRKNMYKMAEAGVLRTEKGKVSFLNGFPIPIHGVAGMEEIMSAIETPFQIRAGSPDHRLVYEIGLAGGASSVEGGFICYLYPYDKRTSPVTSLKLWKYVDKLAEWYLKNYDIIINREYFGPLTTSLIEPSIAISINIVQAILSAKSGVSCISVSVAEQGNRWQDIAAIRALDKMTRLYLSKYGFPKCTVSTVFHQYMAAFPTDINKAREMIFNSSITGTLSRATKFMIKTPVESIQIPTKEDNAEALQITQKGIRAARDIKIDNDVVQKETTILEKQIAAIMNSIEILGQGSLAKGAIRAFQEGILDVPFSPSTFNKNKLLTGRDCGGAIRFINPEVMPFDKEIVDFHGERMHQRMLRERITKTSRIIEEDLTRIWKNDYQRWPLDGVYVN